jgi:hypothetical protein
MSLSILQLQQVLRQAGWPESLVPIMAAIGMAESSGIPNNVNPRGEHSVGLWQINTSVHGTRFGTERQLYDPVTNARAALTLYNERQRRFPNGITVLRRRYTGAQVGLTHWGAFTDGRYRRYLTGSQFASGSPAASNPAASYLPSGLFPSVDGSTAAYIGIGLFAMALVITIARR